MNNKTFEMLGLTKEQTIVLFSLQRLIVENDVEHSFTHKDGIILKKDVHKLKRDWLKKWEFAISGGLSKLCNGRSDLIKSKTELRHFIQEIDKGSQTTIWKYLVLLESVLYVPYYPLGDSKEDKKIFKGLNLHKACRDKSLLTICECLDVDSQYIKKFSDSYKSATRSLSNYWTKVGVTTAVVLAAALAAIPTGGSSIATLFAAEGLHGAAAVASGLAFLGGGAIAAGGFGMAGGWAVLIGGASLLGIGVGGSAGLTIASMSSGMTFSEAAKLQVVLREIILAIQKDTKVFLEILQRINEQNAQLKNEVARLKLETEKDKKKIKNLEKSITYLERMISNVSK